MGLVPAKGSAVFKTDVALRCPSRCYIRLASRSGMAFVNGIHVGAYVQFFQSFIPLFEFAC
jgi:dUTPase